MPARRPAGVTALSFFFVFGMTMSGIAAITLAFADSFLAPVWRVNPKGHEALVALGLLAVAMMSVVSLACVAAAAGLWLGRLWGQRIAMTILLVNAVGDLLNGTLGGDPRSLIGLPVAGALLYYLRSAGVRAFFAAGRD